MRIELATLLFQPSSSGPWIHEPTFVRTPNDAYWTGSLRANTTDSAWFVQLQGGAVDYGQITEAHYVRCVRGGPSTNQPQRFTPSTDVIVDNETGLRWQRGNASDDKAGAEARFGGATTGGLTNWRVPTPAELLTLVDETRANPALDTTLFDVPSSGRHFWTTIRFNGVNGQTVDFLNGATGNVALTSTGTRVRCVHE